MSTLIPGRDGEPLLPGMWVLRLAPVSKDPALTTAAIMSALAPSTGDRNRQPMRVSVWAELLTSYRQAWELTGRRHQVALRMNVDWARALSISLNDGTMLMLDVVWEPLSGDGCEPDTRPGADGHSGITGFGDPRMMKSQRKQLRSQLADRIAEAKSIVQLQAN